MNLQHRLHDKLKFRLSALISKPQNKGSACDGDKQTIKDGTAEQATVKAIAEFTEIHLQMLCASAVVGTIDERFRIACDSVEPLQVFAVGIEILGLVNIAIFQRFAVAFVAVCLNHSPKGNVFQRKLLYGRNLDIIGYFHLQVGGFALLIFGNCDKNALISSSTPFFALDFCAKIGIIEFHKLSENIVLIPHFHGCTNAAQKIPGGFIAHFNLSGQRKSGDPTLVAGYQIDGPEPLVQRKMAAVHHGVSGQSGLVTAVGALETAIAANAITMPVTTDRTLEALGPLHLVEVLIAGVLVGKALDKLAET